MPRIYVRVCLLGGISARSLLTQGGKRETKRERERERERIQEERSIITKKWQSNIHST